MHQVPYEFSGLQSNKRVVADEREANPNCPVTLHDVAAPSGYTVAGRTPLQKMNTEKTIAKSIWGPSNVVPMRIRFTSTI